MMNTKKLLMTGLASLTLAGLAGQAHAQANVAGPSDTLRASLLAFTQIDTSPGRTTLIQISNDRNAEVHIQCLWQTADKIVDSFDFKMSGFETRLFDVKSGDGYPAGIGNQFPPPGSIYVPPLAKGELICFAIQLEDVVDRVLDPIRWDYLTGVARVVQYNAPGWVTEYPAWAVRGNQGVPQGQELPVTDNGDGSFTLNLQGPATGTYEACPRVLLGDLITRPSVVPLGLPGDAGTLTVVENHLYVALCTQRLEEGAPDLYSKLIISGTDQLERSFSYEQCGDTWYDINLGDAAPPVPYWGPRTNWNVFLNINNRWVERYEAWAAGAVAAHRTCGCGGVPCATVLCDDGLYRPYTTGCPGNVPPVPPYRYHPNLTGLWGTQMGVYSLFPANDVDAAASNLHSWVNTYNGALRVDLYPATTKE